MIMGAINPGQPLARRLPAQLLRPLLRLLRLGFAPERPQHHPFAVSCALRVKSQRLEAEPNERRATID
jgi:hypothetical protein